MEQTYLLLWAFAGLCLLLFYLRQRKKIRAFLLGSTTGIVSLLLLHLFGGSIAPTLSAANLLLAVFFGVPGTALSVLAGILLGN